MSVGWVVSVDVRHPLCALCSEGEHTAGGWVVSTSDYSHTGGAVDDVVYLAVESALLSSCALRVSAACICAQCASLAYHGGYAIFFAASSQLLGSLVADTRSFLACPKGLLPCQLTSQPF